MKKNILKLTGAKEITKSQQQSIHGGRIGPSFDCGGRGDIECCGNASW